ncbi:MAG: AAA family ATPase [Chloroflexi bacterium]|nr:AAA family ATPase [Chloroflexota bacterium]
MALSFQRGREVKRGDLWFKILLHGDSGAGKTWLASTAPNCVVLLTERNGEQSIRMANPDARYAIVNTAQEVREFLSLAQKGELGTKDEPVETLVLDGLTEIQRLLKDEMQSQKGDEFSIRDWGELTEKMRRLLRLLRDLPYNVVCTALTEHDTEGDVRHAFPSFQGKKLYSEVMQYFNVVGYVYKAAPDKAGDAVRHVAMFDGPARIACKNQHPLRGVRPGPVSGWISELRDAVGGGAVAAVVEEPPPPVGTKADSRRRGSSAK